MVQERSPRFMVGWKCQGASRCVPLWVESCTCSTAQPCPSGRSSAFNPSKNCSIRGKPCWWSTYWIVGGPPGGSAGTSFCSGTEMSINWRGMGVVSVFSFCLIVASLNLGVKEARALAQVMLIVGRQEIDQYLSLRGTGGIRGDACRIHSRQLAARWKRSGKGDAGAADDL